MFTNRNDLICSVDGTSVQKFLGRTIEAHVLHNKLIDSNIIRIKLLLTVFIELVALLLCGQGLFICWIRRVKFGESLSGTRNRDDSSGTKDIIYIFCCGALGSFPLQGIRIRICIFFHDALSFRKVSCRLLGWLNSRGSSSSSSLSNITMLT